MPKGEASPKIDQSEVPTEREVLTLEEIDAPTTEEIKKDQRKIDTVKMRVRPKERETKEIESADIIEEEEIPTEKIEVGEVEALTKEEVVSEKDVAIDWDKMTIDDIDARLEKIGGQLNKEDKEEIEGHFEMVEAETERGKRESGEQEREEVKRHEEIIQRFLLKDEELNSDEIVNDIKKLIEKGNQKFEARPTVELGAVTVKRAEARAGKFVDKLKDNLGTFLGIFKRINLKRAEVPVEIDRMGKDIQDALREVRRISRGFAETTVGILGRGEKARTKIKEKALGGFREMGTKDVLAEYNRLKSTKIEDRTDEDKQAIKYYANILRKKRIIH